MSNASQCPSETINIEGIKLPLGPHLSDLMVHVYNSLTYEAEELELIRETLLKSDIVMELGAGVGFLSAHCARLIGSARVHAYEANPLLEGPIRKAYELNDVSPELNMCILGDKPGKTTFHVHKDFWASSAISFEGSTETEVEQRSLEAELERVKATFLVIDIEGGEYDLLIKSLLAGVRKLIIEIHPDAIGPEKTRELFQHFELIGFKIDRKTTYNGKHARVAPVRRFYENGREDLEKLPSFLGTFCRCLFKALPQPDCLEKRSYCFSRQ